jgi:hypothetical protein
MILRLTTLAVAALLLFSPAILPNIASIGSSPAHAAEMDSTVKAALDDQTPPSELDKKTIRKRIKALRAAMKSGDLSREDRRQLRQKMKAYRSELKSRRGATTDGEATGKRKKRKGAMEEEQTPKPEMEKQAPAGEKEKQAPAGEMEKQAPAGEMEKQAPAGETEKQAPPKTEVEKPKTAPEEGAMPETQGDQGGMKPKSDTGEKPVATVSDTDCKNLWDSANKNGDDVLTDEEATPFVAALKTSGDTGSGPTIKRSDFMDACMKGAFKTVSP